MSMTSPLEDVVAKGREHYYEGKSFRRWSIIMVHKYGSEVAPYLEDAWKLLEANAKLGVKEGKQPVTHVAPNYVALDDWFTPAVEMLRRLLGWSGHSGQTVKQNKIASALSQEPKSGKPDSTLYRMVAPGRFAPVPEETIDVKIFKHLRTRKTIVAIAAVAFVLTGLFPPWLQTLNLESIHERTVAGYSCVFSPPQPKAHGWDREFYGIERDTSRLLVEWSCIVVATGAAWFLCGASRPKEN